MEKVDHQLVQMHFENGVDATLKMQFCAESGRRVNIFGTHGEIILDWELKTLELRRFGRDPEVFRTDSISDTDNGYDGHGGGDEGLIKDFYSILNGEVENYTSLAESAESHLIGIKAEESRLNGGITLKVHEN